MSLNYLQTMEKILLGNIINDISNGREPFSSKPGDVSEITVDRNADNSFLITNAVDYVQDEFIFQ